MATKITTPELFNLSSNNTAATQLPVFTTSTRPTSTTSTVQVDYLVVAGGGAGGGSALGNFAGGGGGAGGVRTSFTPVSTPANYTILPTLSSSTGTAYNITVGAGGIGVASASTKGGSGANSVFETITATGGGGAGVGQNDNGLTGGSAGGTAPTTSTRTNSVSPTQGFRGGGAATGGSNYGSGGGGGGGAEGVQGTNSKGGNGGIGFQTAITGTATYYAGGGGGGTYKPPSGATSEMGLGGLGGGGDALVRSVGEPGTNGLGGGGGAATNGDGEGGNRAGGDGGSGIVILRYPTSSSSAIKTTGSLVYTESTDGSDTVIRFTEGSGNVSFASAGIAVGEMIFNSTTEKVEYWDGFQWNMIKDEGLPPAISSFTVNPTTLNEGDTFSLIEASLQAPSGIASYVVNAQISGQADAIVFEDTAVAGNPTSLTVSSTTTVAAWNWDSMSVTLTDTNGSSVTSSLVTLSITAAAAYTVELEYRTQNSGVTWVGCTPSVTGNFRSWSYSDNSYSRRIIVTAVAGSTVGVYSGWSGTSYAGSISEYATWPGWVNLRNNYGASTAPPPWVSPSYLCRTGYCTWTNNFPAQNVGPSNTGICAVQ